MLLYDLTQNLVQESQIPVADLPHPLYGTISGPNCNFYSSEIFYQFSSFSDPSSVYRAVVDRDPFNGSIEISFHQVNSIEIPSLDKYHYETLEDICETKDGVALPITRFARKDIIEKNEPSPCIVIVNGGFGITLTPQFSLPLVLFVEYCGGIVIQVNVQGSGLHGEKWASAGAKENKITAINDLESVLNFIIQQNYTTADKIALMGGTFNGFLIGAAIAKFPHLFSTATVIDGIFDLINLHTLNPPQTTIKAPDLWKHTLWYKEFGAAFESEEELTRLLGISPLHTIGKTSQSPSVLLLTGMSVCSLFVDASHLICSNQYTVLFDLLELCAASHKFNLVSCVHSLKFIAQLQRKYPVKPSSKPDKFRPFLLYSTNQDNEFDMDEAEAKLTKKDVTSSATNNNFAVSTSIEELSILFAFIISQTGAAWKP